MAKTFSADRISVGDADLLSGAVDPSAGAGVSAPVGSIFMRTDTGQIYTKTSAPDTGWTEAGNPSALGAMTLVGVQEVIVGPATTLSFAGLNGDTDGIYMAAIEWVKTTPLAAGLVDITFNGGALVGTLTQFDVGNGAATSGDTAPSLVGARVAIGAGVGSSKYAWSTVWLDPATGKPRNLNGIGGCGEGANSLDYFTFNFYGTCQDTGTLITSVEFTTSAVGDWDIGSSVSLYKISRT